MSREYIKIERTIRKTLIGLEIKDKLIEMSGSELGGYDLSPEFKDELWDDASIDIRANEIGIPLIYQNTLNDNNNRIRSGDIKEFFTLIKENEKWDSLKAAYILYSMEELRNEGTNKVAITRRYMTVSASGILGHEFRKYYDIPNIYYVKEITDNEVIFKKRVLLEIFVKVVLTVVTSLLYFWILYSKIKYLIYYMILKLEDLLDRRRNNNIV